MTNDVVTSFTTAEIAEEIRRAGPFEVWNGVCGYDTRPYVGRDPLPVAYVKEFAENFREPEEAQEWGLEEALASLEVGEVVCVPDYCGCNYHGTWEYERTPEGFVALGYRRSHGY